MVASFRMTDIDAQAKASGTFNSRMCLQVIGMKSTRKMTRGRKSQIVPIVDGRIFSHGGH
jgi:hypothetical protein